MGLLLFLATGYWLLPDLQTQAIIGEMDAGREFGVVLGMEDIVAHVREVGNVRLHVRDHLKRLGDAEMHRVRALAERVEHEYIKAAQEIARGGWHLRRVGYVRKLPEPEAEHRRAPMRNRDGDNRMAVDREWAINTMECEGGFSAEKRQWWIIENVGKPLVEGRFDQRVRVDGDYLLLNGIEGAHVVQPGGMVGMRVGEKYGVYMRHSSGERLQSQLRGGINQEVGAIRKSNPYRASRPAITGVIRLTCSTDPPNHRDACRGPGAEKRQRRHRRTGAMRNE